MQIDPSSSSSSYPGCLLSSFTDDNSSKNNNNNNNNENINISERAIPSLWLSKQLSKKEEFGGGCVLNSFREAFHHAEEVLKPNLRDAMRLAAASRKQKRQRNTKPAISSSSSKTKNDGPNECCDDEVKRLPLVERSLSDEIVEFEESMQHLREGGGNGDDELAAVLSLFDGDEGKGIDNNDGISTCLERQWLLSLEWSLHNDIAEFEKNLLHLREGGGGGNDNQLEDVLSRFDEDEKEDNDSVTFLDTKRSSLVEQNLFREITDFTESIVYLQDEVGGVDEDERTASSSSLFGDEDNFEEEDNDDDSLSVEIQRLPSVEQSLHNEITEFQESLLLHLREEGGGSSDEVTIVLSLLNSVNGGQFEQDYSSFSLSGEGKSKRGVMLIPDSEDRGGSNSNVACDDANITSASSNSRSISKNNHETQQQQRQALVAPPMLPQLPSAKINSNSIVKANGNVISTHYFIGTAAVRIRRLVSQSWSDFCGVGGNKTITTRHFTPIIGFCATIGAIGLLGYPPKVQIGTMVGPSIHATGTLISLVW